MEEPKICISGKGLTKKKKKTTHKRRLTKLMNMGKMLVTVFNLPEAEIASLICRLQILLIRLGLKSCHMVNSLPPQSRFLPPLEKKAFENIVRKGENAGNQHFLLSPQCFSTLPNTNFDF